MSDYKTVNFYSKNPESLKVWEDLKKACHARDQYAWQVIRDGLEALQERKAVEETMQSINPEPVIIKQSDGAQYLEKMLSHNHSAYLTPHKSEAMVFNSGDQAAAFLRKCGHEVGNWIVEPA